MPYAFLADLVAAIHALYVGFVVLGLIAILLGGARGWGCAIRIFASCI